MRPHAIWPGIVVALANLVVIAALIFGDMIGVLLAWPASLIGLAALGFGLWKAREPLLLLGFPLLAFPLGLWVMLLNTCAGGKCL